MLGERLCVVFLALFVKFVTPKSVGAIQNELPPTCPSKIYCQGEVLDLVQMSRYYEDSKTFVDMSMLFPPDLVTLHFDDMMKSCKNRPTRGDIKEFLAQNFIEGHELKEWTPSDYKQHPSFLKKIHDAKVKTFAQDIVEIWPKLGRKVVEDVKNNSDVHSMIYVPNGFIIPGGRFREAYYWDSYWIIQGLLISEMHETAKGMIENFLHMVNKYGFIPNGGRVYYLNRSQPPLLTKMVKDYFDATKDEDWLLVHIGTVVKEVEWWINNKFTTVIINDKKYRLATYASESLGPRPESYREDIEASYVFLLEHKQQQLFNELKSAAQSGWDFSSRWIFDKHGGTNANVSFTQTSRLIPVDLNAILYGAFSDLETLYRLLNKPLNQKLWGNQAETLKEAIHDVLWDEEEGMWFDYDTKTNRKRKLFAASNLTPLWTKAYHLPSKEIYAVKAVDYLRREKIDEYKGGIPATKVHSNEQWDFPNAWPPLQSIVVHGLRGTREPQALELAEQFAQNWIAANMIGFEEEGCLFEKYDAVSPGQYGGGGEYHVQIGFGWTNGVVLDFINTYPNTKITHKGRPRPVKHKGRKHQ